MNKLRVAILGPLHLAGLEEFLEPELVEARPLPSGMGGYNLTMYVRERLKRGLETIAITQDPGLEEPLQCWEGRGFQLWVVRRRSRGALRDWFSKERALMGEALRKSGTEFCHANWTYEYGLAAVDRPELPSLVSVHDHSWNCFRHFGLRFAPLLVMSLWVMRRGTNLTAVSDYIRPFVERVAGRAVPVVPNLISLPKLDRTESSGSTRVVSAIHWSSLKNAQRAIRAFSILKEKHPEATYRLIGPRLEEGGAGHQWAIDEGLADGIDFVGPLPHEAVVEEFARARMVFHPSLEESFGMPVAEAMWLGIPVVACAEAGGCRGLLEDGKLGTLVSGRSVESMAAGLAEAWSGSIEVQDKGRAGREEIRTLCDPDSVIEHYSSLYREISGQTG